VVIAISSLQYLLAAPMFQHRHRQRDETQGNQNKRELARSD
jgi:hypothetical protein